MPSPLALPLTLALLALAASAVQAEKADRDQPMKIEADSLRYDDLQQTSLFTGNVVITKGSLVIRGDRVDVRQDPQGYQYGNASASAGKRSYFRQKREGLDEFIEGEAEQIDYDGRADVVLLQRHAVLRRYRGAQLSDETTGERISYNNLTDQFNVQGRTGTGTVPPGATAGGSPPGGGRVRAWITPKPTASSPAPAGPAVQLRASPQLPGEPQ